MDICGKFGVIILTEAYMSMTGVKDKEVTGNGTTHGETRASKAWIHTCSRAGNGGIAAEHPWLYCYTRQF